MKIARVLILAGLGLSQTATSADLIVGDWSIILEKLRFSNKVDTSVGLSESRI